MDEFRRFSDPKVKAVDIARDVHHIRTVLHLYNVVHPVFTTDQEIKEFIFDETPRREGAPALHVGWQRICELVKGKKATAPQKKLYDFVMKDIRGFMQASRELQNPQLPKEPDFWPCLDEALRWKLIGHEGGNSIRVKLSIPCINEKTGEAEKREIEAVVRGHIPFPYSQQLPQALDIKAATQFRPNRSIAFAADEDRAQKLTYFKMQAMRLILEDGRVFARISASHMTQVQRDPKVTKELAKNIRIGERVGVLHMVPGGSLLCYLTCFEKVAEGIGWKHVPITEIVADTSAASFEVREAPGKQAGELATERVHVANNLHLVKREFLAIDDMHYAVRAAKIEDEKRARTAGQSIMDNAPILAKAGQMKTNLGATHYKRVAARIARICARNCIGYLVATGGGRLAVFPSIPHPVKKFFSFSTGARVEPSGYLVNALKKVGVSVLITRGRAARIWVKSAVLKQDFESCQMLEMPLPAGKDRQNWPKNWKNPKLIADPSNPNSKVPFARNAAWAILLDHQNAQFHKQVDSLIEKAERERLAA